MTEGTCDSSLAAVVSRRELQAWRRRRAAQARAIALLLHQYDAGLLWISGVVFIHSFMEQPLWSHFTGNTKASSSPPTQSSASDKAGKLTGSWCRRLDVSSDQKEQWMCFLYYFSFQMLTMILDKHKLKKSMKETLFGPISLLLNNKMIYSSVFISFKFPCLIHLPTLNTVISTKTCCRIK